MAIHMSRPADDVVALTDVAPIPGLGFLPVNAYVLHSEQPLLVDSGLPTSRADFLEALWSQIEPADLRWIYLTHPDRDHTGSLMEILEAAPAARLVTTFLGLGILSLEYQISLDRIFLLNPGQSLDLGDRRLTAFRPPVYDSPATTGFYDQRTGTCFTSDCFGSPVASADLAAVEDIGAIATDDLLAGQRLWATVDSPWVTSVDRAAFRAALQPLRQLDPAVVLCTHLPPAHGATAQLLDTLEAAPDADPFMGPDQAALEAMLAEMEPAHA
jgi:glyoxylase-like metal-dependent hydrolase (beta-lactamase superfamily II)